jgi:tetratricopeptide (TPR) repeat protein
MTATTVLLLKNEGGESFRLKNYNKAVQSYTAAIEQAHSEDPNLAALYSNRCACYLLLNRVNEALDDAQSCVSVKPTWAKSYSRLGSCMVKLNRINEAIAAYERAVSLEPNNRDYRASLDSLTRGNSSRSNRFGDPRNGITTVIDFIKQIGIKILAKLSSWWSMLTEQQQMYSIMGILGLLIYYFFFRSSYSDPYNFNGYSSTGNLSWSSWAAIMLAAYKIPPMFPQIFGDYARPFFGMSWTTFMWLLDMVTRNRGNMFNNRYGGVRRRGFY